MQELGKTLIIIGIITIIAGFMVMSGKTFGLGKLPGDIAIKKENFSFHFPIVTCLILSVILTIVLRVFGSK